MFMFFTLQYNSDIRNIASDITGIASDITSPPYMSTSDTVSPCMLFLAWKYVVSVASSGLGMNEEEEEEEEDELDEEDDDDEEAEGEEEEEAHLGTKGASASSWLGQSTPLVSAMPRTAAPSAREAGEVSRSAWERRRRG